MKNRRGRRGATLIEALVALAALGVGTAGIASLISHLSKVHRREAFQTASLDMLATFSTQVRDAACDVLPGTTTLVQGPTDPGFFGVGYQTTPIVGSSITLVGDVAGTPPMRLSYNAVREVVPLNFAGPPSFDVSFRIREITNDPTLDDPNVTEGYWIRNFTVKKVCNLRTEQDGRGEFY